MAEVGRLGFLVGKVISHFLGGKLVVKLPGVFVGSNSYGLWLQSLCHFGTTHFEPWRTHFTHGGS